MCKAFCIRCSSLTRPVNRSLTARGTIQCMFLWLVALVSRLQTLVISDPYVKLNLESLTSSQKIKGYGNDTISSEEHNLEVTCNVRNNI
jgi:hypothetical protein